MSCVHSTQCILLSQIVILTVYAACRLGSPYFTLSFSFGNRDHEIRVKGEAICALLCLLPSAVYHYHHARILWIEDVLWTLEKFHLCLSLRIPWSQCLQNSPFALSISHRIIWFKLFWIVFFKSPFLFEWLERGSTR